MKTSKPLLHLLILLLAIVQSPSVIAAGNPPIPATDVSMLLREPEFRNKFARSLGIPERDVQTTLIDTDSGKVSVETVITLKLPNGIKPQKAADSLRAAIKQSLSSNFSGSQTTIKNLAPDLTVVSVNGLDQGRRVRIEADIFTLRDGSLLVKYVSITSPEP